MDLSTMTQVIMAKIPVAMTPTAADGALISQYKQFFKKHEDTIVRGFYDIVYSDPHTNTNLEAAARPTRENTLRQWYQITTSGHFDQHYWTWQALIGIVHVKHDIPNPSMLGMWAWMMSFLQTRLMEELPANEALEISCVLQKLQATACSLVVESFILTQQEAITRSSGLTPAILNRFIHIEIDNLLKQGRAVMQANMSAHAHAA